MKNFYAHETAIIDEGCSIGKETKIWHFSHVMSKCIIGDKCNIGQNVVIFGHLKCILSMENFLCIILREIAQGSCLLELHNLQAFLDHLLIVGLH